MEKETITTIKLTKAELTKLIADFIGVRTNQVTHFDTYEVPDDDGYDGYSFGGVNLTFKHDK